jgi:peptide/nickel transport system permease protein
MIRWMKSSPLVREPRVWVGGIILLAILMVALLAPWLAPHDPGEQDLLNILLPPAWAHGGDHAFPLGTDNLGRCVLSRLIYGARVAVIVATLAPLGAALVGTVLALIAGYFGGLINAVISRAVDIWMSLPPVVLALIFMVGFGAGLRNVILAIIVINWTRFCRILRGEVMVLMKRDYIAAARITGLRPYQVIIHDLLPGILPTLMILFSVEMGIAVVVEAVMSFIGLSVEPDVTTWGVMVADGLSAVFSAPTSLIFPMTAIILMVLGSTLLGDGLRRSTDPRLLERGGVTA